MATDYIKTVQSRLSRKGTKVSRPQIKDVFNQIVVAPLAPTEDELTAVATRLEEIYQKPTQQPVSDLAPVEQPASIQPQEDISMTPAQPAQTPAQTSNSALATSELSNMAKPNLGLTEQEIQKAVEQQFGKENVETKTAILNYVAQDTFSTAQELQTALGKLRQMKLDILMKLISDHNQQSAGDEDLLKTALMNASASRREETEVFFAGFENQLLQMRASFGI